MSVSRRGALIVLEGCDRAGKSTQCRRLVEALQKEHPPAQLIKFPDRTTIIGRQIDAYLGRREEMEDHSIHLLFSANRWELVPRMKQLIEAGTTLVVDRYAYSGAAFTAAKKIAPLVWCKGPDVGLPAPDLVIFLKLSAEAARQRSEFGSERYEQTDFQEEVKTQFASLAQEEGQGVWHELDATLSIESLHQEVLGLAREAITKATTTPLGELWSQSP